MEVLQPPDSSDELEFETQTDILTLLENVRCQGINQSGLKQAFLALSTICSSSVEAQEYFRVAEGVRDIVRLVKSSACPVAVVPAALFCLACAVKKNVISQNIVLNAHFLTVIQSFLSHEDDKIVDSAAFLLACTVADNGKGQQLVYETNCLKELLNILRVYLQDGHASDNKWSVITKALGVCVNNPQNERNQGVCCSLLPLALKFIGTDPYHQCIHHVLSLITSIVTNNECNQNRLRKCGGLDELVNFIRLGQRDLENPRVSVCRIIGAVTALDACIADNASSGNQVGDMGMISVIIDLVSDLDLDCADHKTLLLAVAHILESDGKFGRHIIEGKGYNRLVELLTSSQDEELFKTIKYIFTLCKAKDEKRNSGGPDDEGTLGHTSRDFMTSINEKLEALAAQIHGTEAKTNRPIPERTVSSSQRYIVDRSLSKNWSNNRPASNRGENQHWTCFPYREENMYLGEDQEYVDSCHTPYEHNKARKKIEYSYSDFRNCFDEEIHCTLNNHNSKDTNTSQFPTKTRTVMDYDLNVDENEHQIIRDDGCKSFYMRPSGSRDKHMYSRNTHRDEMSNCHWVTPTKGSLPETPRCGDGKQFCYRSAEQNGDQGIGLSYQDESVGGYYKRNVDCRRDLTYQYPHSLIRTSDSQNSEAGPRDEVKYSDVSSENETIDKSSCSSSETRGKEKVSHRNSHPSASVQTDLKEPSTGENQDICQVNVSENLNCTNYVPVSEKHSVNGHSNNKNGNNGNVDDLATVRNAIQTSQLELLNQFKTVVGSLLSFVPGATGGVPKLAQTSPVVESETVLDVLAPQQFYSGIPAADKNSSFSHNEKAKTQPDQEPDEFTFHSSQGKDQSPDCSITERDETSLQSFPEEVEKSHNGDQISNCETHHTPPVNVIEDNTGRKSVGLLQNTPNQGLEVGLRSQIPGSKDKIGPKPANQSDAFAKPSFPAPRSRDISNASKRRNPNIRRAGNPLNVSKSTLSWVTNFQTDLQRTSQLFPRVPSFSPALSDFDLNLKAAARKNSVLSCDKTLVPATCAPSALGSKMSVRDLAQSQPARKIGEENIALKKGATVRSPYSSTSGFCSVNSDTLKPREEGTPLYDPHLLDRKKAPLNRVTLRQACTPQLAGGSSLQRLREVATMEHPHRSTEKLKKAIESKNKEMSNSDCTSKEQCPGCTPSLELNSRTFNIAIETSRYTCSYHRSVRQLEREEIRRQTKGSKLSDERQDHGLQNCSLSPIRNEKDVYHFTSADDEDVSSPHLDVSLRSIQTALKKKGYGKKKQNELRRPRVPYSEEEIANLLQGVSTMGRRWQQILCSYKFHPSRTSIDLKDKFKRIKMTEVEESRQRRPALPFSMCEVRRLKRGVKMFGYNWKAILAGSKFLPGRTAADLRDKWRALNKVAL